MKISSKKPNRKNSPSYKSRNPFQTLLNNVNSNLKKKLTTKVTDQEFYAIIENNPSVFEQWNTPLEISEYVNCKNSPITHLSPHLIFSGKDKNGNSADFTLCKSLQIATGTYPRYVDFEGSGIHSIQNLDIQLPDIIVGDIVAGDFRDCPNLHTLENLDLAKKIQIEPEKLNAEIKRRKALQKFHSKTQPKELPFL